MKREHGDGPVESAIAINNEVRGEDDGGKETKNTSGQVQEKPTGASGDFRRIFLQARGINLGDKRDMLYSFSKIRHVARPVSGEVATVSINRWQGEHGEQGARKRQNENEKHDGKTASGTPAADVYLLNHANGRRQHHGEQRAHINEHEHVTDAISHPQSEDHAEEEQNV